MRQILRSAARRFFYACMILMPINCLADTFLHTGAWSKHVGREDYNENHKLLVIENNSVVAGYFENSYRNDSFLAAYRWGRVAENSVELSVMVGAVYGYSHCLKGDDGSGKTLCPVIAPAVTYTRFRLQPSLLLMGNAVALSFRWQL